MEDKVYVPDSEEYEMAREWVDGDDDGPMADAATRVLRYLLWMKDNEIGFKD